jgi:hypothetical protein
MRTAQKSRPSATHLFWVGDERKLESCREYESTGSEQGARSQGIVRREVRSSSATSRLYGAPFTRSAHQESSCPTLSSLPPRFCTGMLMARAGECSTARCGDQVAATGAAGGLDGGGAACSPQRRATCALESKTACALSPVHMMPDGRW